MTGVTFRDEADSRRAVTVRPSRTAALPPRRVSPSRSLLTAAVAAGLLAVVLAVGRATAGDDVVRPAVTACVRGVSYLGLMLGAGAVGFVALIWPEGRLEPRLASTVWVGWLTVGTATVLQLALHDGAGALSPGGDRIATALALRLGLLLVGAVWMGSFLRGQRPRPLVGVVWWVAIACTWIYAGPVEPGAVTVAVTLTHLAAACMWAGGLAVLAAVLLPQGTTPPLDDALGQFSRLAPACVGVLAVSGTYHAWSRAGSVAHLFSTPYGYAFWLKVAAVAAMLLVANGNRRYVARHVDLRPGGGSGWRSATPLQMLGLFLGAEIAFGVLVMVLTGVLVDASVSP